MRVLLAAMFVMAMAPPARACPHGSVCVSAGTRPPLQLHVAEPVRHAPLQASLETHVVPKPATVEMPWIWVMLRTTVYTRLPTYRHVSRRPENKFSLVLAPVVVSTPQDVVPGAGIQGGF